MCLNAKFHQLSGNSGAYVSLWVWPLMISQFGSCLLTESWDLCWDKGSPHFPLLCSVFTWIQYFLQINLELDWRCHVFLALICDVETAILNSLSRTSGGLSAPTSPPFRPMVWLHCHILSCWWNYIFCDEEKSGSLKHSALASWCCKTRQQEKATTN